MDAEATGSGEFDWLAHQILYDELVRNIRRYRKFFAPTLVVSPKHDILDVVIAPFIQPSVVGWVPTLGNRPSTRSLAFGNGSLTVRSKCPGLLQTWSQLIVFSMTPDVSPVTKTYVKQYRSGRLALGGVDDGEINTASGLWDQISVAVLLPQQRRKPDRSLLTDCADCSE